MKQKKYRLQKVNQWKVNQWLVYQRGSRENWNHGEVLKSDVNRVKKVIQSARIKVNIEERSKRNRREFYKSRVDQQGFDQCVNVGCGVCNECIL